MSRVITAVLACVLVAECRSVLAADLLTAEEEAEFYQTQVQPILQAHCYTCHGGGAEDDVQSGFNLTTRQGLLQGGDYGPAIALDDLEDSVLLRAINYEDLEMPPKGKLPRSQIDILSRWIKSGAPWSDDSSSAHGFGPPAIDERARNFWSFRPVVRPTVPEVEATDRVQTPIDAFILAKLEAARLSFSPPATKTSLLRRVYYDLIGLPPTIEEVEAFLADTSPDAYEKVVDRLLASPQHGERWARHWLDLVRYGETNSFEFDRAKPGVWHYRDYVIRSFNEDKPYDQFVREQLAGDELDSVTADGIIATGYYRLGATDGGAPDKLQAVFDELDDIVATTGQVFLGVTINCARCHDHKIDPISAKDYYRMLAFFRGIERRGRRRPQPINLVTGKSADRDELEKYEQRLEEFEQGIEEIEDTLVPHLEAGELDDFNVAQYRPDIIRAHTPEHISQESLERYESLLRQRQKLKKNRPAIIARPLRVVERGRKPPATFVLYRGNARVEGEQVEPGFLSVLSTELPEIPAPKADATSSGRRRVLADWIANADNRLSARVMVNRVWQYHFGRGLVRSSNDFGYGGTPPTHPQLLDWLASEFVSGGWKLKPLHKLLVMSNAYQMSSLPRAAALAEDPENDLLWRFDMRRIEAEEIRDSILAVCGNLNPKMGGPSIYPRIAEEVHATQSRPGIGWDESSPEEQARRSIYIHIKRSLIVPLLAVFDVADTDASCPVRFATTQPTQALAMLNGDFLNEQAEVFADDVRRLVGDDRVAQVELVLRRVTQREVTTAEIDRGIALLDKLQEEHEVLPEAALQNFCLMAMNLNEFVYLD